MKKLLLFFALLPVCAFGQHGTDMVINTAHIESVCLHKLNFAADAEASDTYVITLSPIPFAYYTGMMFSFTANTANTGAATLNVNALGAKTIKKLHDQDLATGDIEAGQVVVVIYDGTNLQMISQLAQ